MRDAQRARPAGIECVAQEVAFIRFSGIVSGKDQVRAFGGIHVTHIDIVCSGGHLPVDQVRIVARLVQRGTETFRFIASYNEAERLHRCLVFTHLERKDDDGYISRIEGKCMETERIGPADMRLARLEASAVGSRAAEDETDAAVKETVSSDVSAPRVLPAMKRRKGTGLQVSAVLRPGWPRRARPVH